MPFFTCSEKGVLKKPIIIFNAKYPKGSESQFYIKVWQIRDATRAKKKALVGACRF